ncbi:MAG: capsule assembly Wzi family protein [bacterium]|nr:capsule assembly Wzi family protein [bacterium]
MFPKLLIFILVLLAGIFGHSYWSKAEVLRGEEASFHNPQSAIRNPQSAIRNPQSNRAGLLIREEVSFYDGASEEYYHRLDQDEFGKKLNLRWQLYWDRQWGERFSISLAPSIKGGALPDIEIYKGYLKLNWKTLRLELGRDNLWWGPGYHGALILSTNAPPFDLIKLDTSYRWFSFSLFLTKLEEDRKIPHPFLTGSRLKLDLPWGFNLGGSRVIMLGGEGRPGLKWADVWTILSGKNVEDAQDSAETNQLAAVDIAWRHEFKGHNFSHRPSLIEIYGEFGGEDEAGSFPIISGYILGLALVGSKTGFRIEQAGTCRQVSWSDFLPNWYGHHVYQTGYRYQGQIIGHHMDGAAKDLFIGLGRQLKENLYAGLELSEELHEDVNRPDERQREIITFFSYDTTRGQRLSVRHVYTGRTNAGHTKGNLTKENFIQFRIDYPVP